MSRTVSQENFGVGRTVDQRDSPFLEGDNKMASLNLEDGSVSAPSLTFGDSKTGLYRSGSNSIGISSNGTKIVDVKSTGMEVTGNISVTGEVDGVDLADLKSDYDSKIDQALLTTSGVSFDGIVVSSNFLPAISFKNHPGTGMGCVSDTIIFNVEEADSLTLTENQVRVLDGTVGVPSFSFRDDSDTGMYRVGSDQLGFSVGGTCLLEIRSTGVYTSILSGYPDQSISMQASSGEGLTVDSSGNVTVDNILFLNGQPTHIREKSGDQEISSETDTKVTFDTDVSNKGGITCDGSTFTVPVGGIYFISYNVNWSSGSSGLRNSNIKVGMARYGRLNFGTGLDGGQGIFIGSSALVPLNANASFYLEVWHDDPSPLYIRQDSTSISVALIS